MPALKNPRHEAFAQAVARGMTTDDQDPVKTQQMDSLLKKPEIKRDNFGRFEQNGTGLRKKGQVIKKAENNPVIVEKLTVENVPNRGRGRPKGSKNKMTMALREQILESLDRVGGVDYLARLAIENSSAYASLLSRVLPSTLALDSESKGDAVIRFERIIVHADGRREVDGQTPKQIEHRPNERQSGADARDLSAQRDADARSFSGGRTDEWPGDRRRE